jgi:hypothetical protein
MEIVAILGVCIAAVGVVYYEDSENSETHIHISM